MNKRLVICCDGTWNRADAKHPTNVVKMARAVLPRDDEERPQVVFYDQGVGSGNWYDRIAGGAFGAGLSENIQQVYRFLVHNYEPGDELFFFGFSRGAFTARSTAGLIRSCGILAKEFSDRIPEAFERYAGGDFHPRSKPATNYRLQFSYESRVRFIGVWDTVGALGVPVSWLNWITRPRHQFHDVQLSSWVDEAYHALAVDERRRPFEPTLWEADASTEQKVEQVWFSGVHSDVGGGYSDSGLADEALLWMAEKARACSLALNEDYLRYVARPTVEGALHRSLKGFHRLLGSRVRQIGRGEAFREAVHPSAWKRQADPGVIYDPRNLRAAAGRLSGTREPPAREP